MFVDIDIIMRVFVKGSHTQCLQPKEKMTTLQGAYESDNMLIKHENT